VLVVTNVRLGSPPSPLSPKKVALSEHYPGPTKSRGIPAGERVKNQGRGGGKGGDGGV